MAGGFSVSIGSDTRLFEQGVKTGVIAPVEDAQDALQDLANTSTSKLDGDLRDSERALDKLGKAGKEAGDDLEQGLRGAQKETGRTEAEYREMTEKIRAETAKIKAQSKEDFEGAGGATGEFKEEALQNFSEVTSSFQGNMTSITDLAQGTFGGLASLGGPASLVFGGLAVAVGLIGQAFATSSEESDEFKQKIQDLADTKLSDLFGQYQDSGDDLARGLRKWAQDADSFGGSLSDLQKNTKAAKLDAGTYAAAIATQSVPRMKQLRSEVEAHIKSLDHQAAAQRGAGAGSSALANQIGKQADAAREVKKQLDQNLKVNDAYEKSLRAVAKAQGMTVEQYTAWLDAQQKAQDATQAFTDAISSQAQTMSDTSSDTLSNEAANADAYIVIQQHKIDAVKQFADNAGKVYQDVDDQTRQYLESQGTAMSEEYATYLAATPAQQAKLREQWTIEAKIQADPSDIDKATAAQGKKTAKGPTSEIKGDTKDVDKKVADKGREKKAGPTSKIQADDSAVDRAIASLRKKRFNGPTAVFQVDRSSVDSTISSLRRTTVNVSVKAVP